MCSLNPIMTYSMYVHVHVMIYSYQKQMLIAIFSTFMAHIQAKQVK